MAEENEFLKESSALIKEIESQLEKVLLKKKEEIEKSLGEKIRQEKEEAEKKIHDIEKEFEKEKQALKEYRALMTDFKSNKASIQNQIKDHLNKALQHQKDIEKLAGLTFEELKRVIELSQKLEDLRLGAEEKAHFLRKDIQEKFGIVTEVPETKEREELLVDLDQELTKLKKIKDILGTEPEINTQKMKAEKAPPEKERENEFQAEIPKINEVIEKSISREEFIFEEEAQPEERVEEHVEEKAEERPPLEGDNFQTAFEILEKYRKSDFNENNREVSYFQKGYKIILDGEAFIQTINNILEESKKLYLKLDQTEAPKDQFFIKQELINHQEMLRKHTLRCVRMCERDSCSLAKYTDKILNMDVLKDLLERLNMANWSNEEDFLSFVSYAVSLKDAFYRRITPPAIYLRSLVDELQA